MSTAGPPSRWTRRRIALAAVLAIHWIGVLVWSAPDSPWRQRMLHVGMWLPSWNTHQNELHLGIRRQPAVQTWLMATAQTQRWRMFLPRRPNVSRLELRYVFADGDSTSRRLVGDAGKGSYLQPRWRFLEWALLNPDRRDSYVPAAQPALARALGMDDAREVHATKWAYPVPLLEPDGTGNPEFTTARGWRDLVRSGEEFVPIPLGDFPLGREP